jgi:Flp pilus assembly protein TadD
MTIRFLSLVFLTCVAYFPAHEAGFVWDDEDGYVMKNPYLFSAQGLIPIWFDPGATPQFYPLVFTTFWVEYHLWGYHPMGYHIVNVLLHGLNSGLLFLLMRRLNVPGAWLIAAIFAVHPVHVESVVWVTERKNVLSGACYLGAFLAYLRFATWETPADGPRAWRWYALSLVLFFGALLSKTVTCSLPAVLILVWWWKRGLPTLREFYPLVPMFVLGAAMAATTSWVEREYVGATGEDFNLTAVERCLIAGRALCFYVGKLFWPHPLMFNYPRWHIDATDPWQYVYPAVVLAVGLILLIPAIPLWPWRRQAAPRPPARGPLTACLIFAGTLVPALGFFNVYPMKFYFVADHFVYLASTAIIALAVAGVWRFTRHWPLLARNVLAILAGALLMVLGYLTWHQCKIYRDPDTLWLDTATKNPTAFLAQFNLGTGYLKQDKLDLAIRCFAEAEKSAKFADLYANWGIALAKKGDYVTAYQKLSQALTYPSGNPGREAKFPSIRMEMDARTSFNLAKVLEQQLGTRDATEQQRLDMKKEMLERYASAAGVFQKLIKGDPYNPNLVENLEGAGYALMKLGQHEEAAECYRRLVELAPQNSGYRQNLEKATSR